MCLLHRLNPHTVIFADSEEEGSQPVEMEPNLKTSAQHLKQRLAGARPGQGWALRRPPELCQRGSKVAKAPDDPSSTKAPQEDAHFEVFLGNFVTKRKPSQSSVPAKFSGLNRAIVHPLSI